MGELLPLVKLGGAGPLFGDGPAQGVDELSGMPSRAIGRKKLVPVILRGRSVRLEPLDYGHVDGIAAAAAEDPSLYRWSPVPQGVVAARQYVETARSWFDAGTALPFAVVRTADERVVGSTRLWNVEFWGWPEGHAHFGRDMPDACEVGYTWLARSAVRTAINTESKLLLFSHAFEEWQVRRVCLHTDVRNERSRTAILRLGATFEGVLRAHRLAADFVPRDSARYSILDTEWPLLKGHLLELLSAP